MRRRRKTNKIYALILILLVVSLGFATLSTTLKINGTSTLNKNTWNIYWDNIANKKGVTPQIEPEIIEDVETIEAERDETNRRQRPAWP